MKVKDDEDFYEMYKRTYLVSMHVCLCKTIGATRSSRLYAAFNRTFRDARTDGHQHTLPARITPFKIRWNGVKTKQLITLT